MGGGGGVISTKLVLEHYNISLPTWYYWQIARNEPSTHVLSQSVISHPLAMNERYVAAKFHEGCTQKSRKKPYWVARVEHLTEQRR